MTKREDVVFAVMAAEGGYLLKSRVRKRAKLGGDKLEKAIELLKSFGQKPGQCAMRAA